MDISFHYFAVKTLALEAGFPEAEAQRIAVFSQFIDDFHSPVDLRCGNVPRHIRKARQLDLYKAGGNPLEGNFDPVSTGFGGLTDYGALLLPRTQRFTVAPFHFLPASPRAAGPDVRTVPARLGDGSTASALLLDARARLLGGASPRRAALMRVGMGLHSFADTYAHQLFSGWNSWVNDVRLERVTDETEGRDVTALVLGERERAAAQCAAFGRGAGDWRGALPRIGHMWAGHAPDRSWLSFRLRYRAQEGDADHSLSSSRSNAALFTEAAAQILDYLRSCLGRGPVSGAAWAELSARLERAFLFRPPERGPREALAAHWASVFPGRAYSYDAAVVEAGFRPGGGDLYSADFYAFNRIADELLIRLYGPQPRRRN